MWWIFHWLNRTAQRTGRNLLDDWTVNICSTANYSLARAYSITEKEVMSLKHLKNPSFFRIGWDVIWPVLIILLTNKLTEYKVSKTHFRTIFMCGDCTQETWAPLPSLCSNTCYVVLNTYLILTICWEIPKQEKKTFWLQRCLLKNDRLKQVIIKCVIISCPKQPFLLSHEERFLSTSMISVKSVSKPSAVACSHTQEAEAKEGWVQG